MTNSLLLCPGMSLGSRKLALWRRIMGQNQLNHPDNRQTTIRNYFLKYPLKVRQQVQFITMDMSGAYIPWLAKLFSKRKIVFEHHPAPWTCLLKTRIAIMNQFDKKSLPYRALKNHWRLFQRTAVSYPLNSFYSKTFHKL